MRLPPACRHICAARHHGPGKAPAHPLRQVRPPRPAHPRDQPRGHRHRPRDRALRSPRGPARDPHRAPYRRACRARDRCRGRCRGRCRRRRHDRRRPRAAQPPRQLLRPRRPFAHGRPPRRPYRRRDRRHPAPAHRLRDTPHPRPRPNPRPDPRRSPHNRKPAPHLKGRPIKTPQALIRPGKTVVRRALRRPRHHR